MSASTRSVRPGLGRGVLSILLLLALPATLQADELQGYWQCQEAGVGYTLEFQAANKLLYNGQPTTYQLALNTLFVQEETGTVGYYYQLEGATLTFYSPDGSPAQCQKGTKPAVAATPPQQQPQQAARPGTGSHPAQEVVPGRNWPIYARPQGVPAWNTTDPQTLVYKFAGRWDHVTANTLSNIYLKPDGSYEDAYEAGYSGTFENQGGYQTGNWGTAGAEQSGGYWTIQGTLEQGTITLNGNNGSRTVLNYQVYVRNGEYFGDYYFNGKLHTVKYIYR